MPKRNLWVLTIVLGTFLAWGIPAAASAYTLTGQAAISTPEAGVTVGGKVPIRGSAFIDPPHNFWYYKVEYNAGLQEEGWARINRTTRPTDDGLLVTWDTRLLYNGHYYLRVVTVDKTGNFIRSEPILVRIDNGPDAPLWPEPVELEKPLDGEIIGRLVKIEGTVTPEFLTLPEFQGKYPEIPRPSPYGRPFAYFKVEYSPGPNFDDWHLIGGQVTRPKIRQRLASWETTGLPNGDYALRLQMVFENGNFFERRIFVTVDNPPIPQETRIEISSPGADQAILRKVGVFGSAALDPAEHEFGNYYLEYGQGPEPEEWSRIARGHYPVLETNLDTWDVSRLPNGLYSLRLRVEDASGQEIGQDQVLVTVDNPPPPTVTVAEIIEPADGEVVVQKAKIQGSAALDSRKFEFGRFTLTYGQGPNPTDWIEIRSSRYPELDTRLIGWDVSDLPNGPYTLRLQVKDATSEVIRADQVAITVDNPPPPTVTAVEITSPEEEDVVRQLVSVKGWAVLDSREYDFGRYVLDYGQGRNPTVWNRIKTGSFPVLDDDLKNWRVNELPNGVYTLRLQVQAPTRQVVREHQVAVMVENPPPPLETKVEISSPVAGQDVVRKVAVKGSAALDSREYEFGSYVLEYGQGRNPIEWVELKQDEFPLLDSKFRNWDVSALSNGPYTLRLRVEDATGLVAEEDRVLVIVENPPPPTETKVEISAPESGDSVSLKVKVEGTATLDAAEYEFGTYVLEFGQGRNPSEWVEIERSHFPDVEVRLATWEIHDLKNGAYSLRLRVLDASGKSSFEDQVLVNVENPPPPAETRVEITWPDWNQVITGTANIKGSAALAGEEYTFGRYLLQYGQGREPTEWLTLDEVPYPEVDVTFTSWDTSSLPEGPYTLRLLVEDARGEVIEQDRVPVIVDH